MKKLLLIMFLTSLFLLLGFCALQIYFAFQNGHTWSDMDWNSDGRVTFKEVLEGSEIGQRAIIVEGENCTEFFMYKDAFRIKIDCNE